MEVVSDAYCIDWNSVRRGAAYGYVLVRTHEYPLRERAAVILCAQQLYITDCECAILIRNQLGPDPKEE